MDEHVIGIMGAMTEEVEGVVSLLQNRKETVIGMRSYYSGDYNDQKLVVVFSRWGKVAAATTVTTLITEFNVSAIIFTGVAGAINSALRIGDIVIGKELMQHDLDARPMIGQFEIPLIHKSKIDSSASLIALSSVAVNQLIEEGMFKLEPFIPYNNGDPKLFIGDIASGDQFIASQEDKKRIHDALPSVMCVEMEGGAVAQICYEYNIPFVVIRTISDTADHDSPDNFQEFTKDVANLYSKVIIRRIIDLKPQIQKLH